MSEDFKISSLVDKSKSYEPIPVGTYNIVMDSVERKVDADNEKITWSFKMKIVDGDFKNRTF